MRLTELIPGAGTGGTDPDIRGLTADSRQVRPGWLFAALPGTHADGRAFIGQALDRGAAAILTMVNGAPGADVLDQARELSVPVIDDGNPRRALAHLAAAYYQRQPERQVAVTGTNGKTSVVWFAKTLWQVMGLQSACLGTLGVRAGRHQLGASMTTPDPVVLHETLADLDDAGFDRLALEASSHGLDQYRLDGLRLRAAAFTNLSRDHLDYHPDMASYLAAKRRLFSEILPDGGTAVLNADIPEFSGLAAACRRRLNILTFGRNGDDLRLLDQAPTAEGQTLTVQVRGRCHRLDLPLIGDFQAANALAAAGLVAAAEEGDRLDEVVALLPRLTNAPGRMALAATRRCAGGSAGIYVDYAHTPDALATALAAIRPHVAGRLVVVFGCGGDRDAGKRPLMGRAAAHLADRVIITDDNPRSESPVAIRAEIRAACPGATEIGDRAEAIAAAIAGLAAGDVLLIAGKGHETYQIVGDRTLAFDDAAVARQTVRDLDGETGR